MDFDRFITYGDSSTSNLNGFSNRVNIKHDETNKEFKRKDAEFMEFLKDEFQQEDLYYAPFNHMAAGKMLTRPLVYSMESGVDVDTLKKLEDHVCLIFEIF